MQNKVNGALTVKIKRVNAYNLVQSANVGVSKEDVETLVSNMKRCALTRLLESTNPREVAHFMDRLLECLSRDNIFPPPPEKVDKHIYEQCDIDQVARTLAGIRASEDTVTMKVVILAGLRVSTLFLQIFCPPPSPTLDRHFLVDPDALLFFLSGENNPLQCHITAFVVGRASSPEKLVTDCLTSWLELGSWRTHDTWSRISANEPSAELHAVAKRLRLEAGENPDNHEQARLEAPNTDSYLLDF